MATKSISQMTTAATVDNGDLFEIAHPDAGSATGYASNKQSLAAIADHMATAVNHPTLNTTAKNIVGAINELEAGGGGGGSSTLAGLTDVDISSPTNGQALVYDANAAKWKNGAGGGGGGIDYSETEQDTGLKWIDGKTVYQKTFKELITANPSGGKYTIQHNISNIETVISVDGVINHKTVVPYGETFPSKDSTMGRVSVKAQYIEIGASGGWVDYIFIITIRYTKSAV